MALTLRNMGTRYSEASWSEIDREPFLTRKIRLSEIDALGSKQQCKLGVVPCATLYTFFDGYQTVGKDAIGLSVSVGQVETTERRSISTGILLEDGISTRMFSGLHGLWNFVGEHEWKNRRVSSRRDEHCTARRSLQHLPWCVADSKYGKNIKNAMSAMFLFCHETLIPVFQDHVSSSFLRHRLCLRGFVKQVEHLKYFEGSWTKERIPVGYSSGFLWS